MTDSTDLMPPPDGARLAIAPTARAAGEERAQRRMLLAVRVLYLIALATMVLLPFVGALEPTEEANVSVDTYLPMLIATFVIGTAVLVFDVVTPRKRLSTAFAIYVGVLAGLLASLAIGYVIDLVADSWDLQSGKWTAYRQLAKSIIAVTLCYIAVSIVLTTSDDIRLVIPYVEFAKQVRGVRPLLLDSSALIDGRVETIAGSGFLDAPVIVPQFVVEELQTLADSGDRNRRTRGRRGLDVLGRMRTGGQADLTIDPLEAPAHAVDHKLIQVAREQSMRVVTTDFNLEQVARIQGVTVLNVNDLANHLRPQLLPGDLVEIEINRRGESPGQGVGFMTDGTMVVVEQAADLIGEKLSVTVTNALQTAAGRMVFAQLRDNEETPVDRMGDAATAQPRTKDRPERKTERSRRNPRR